jgi:hypothetical protein
MVLKNRRRLELHTEFSQPSLNLSSLQPSNNTLELYGSAQEKDSKISDEKLQTSEIDSGGNRGRKGAR